LLVRANGSVADERWHADEVGLEDIVLAYLGQLAARAILSDPRGQGVVL
jgi:hypothetical protein